MSEPIPTKIIRTADGKFGKGNIANPGGRPRKTVEVRELARQHTDLAISKLVEILNDPASPANAKVLAANAILDRGYGRPVQALEVEGTGAPVTFTLNIGAKPNALPELPGGDDTANSELETETNP